MLSEHRHFDGFLTQALIIYRVKRREKLQDILRFLCFSDVVPLSESDVCEPVCLVLFVVLPSSYSRHSGHFLILISQPFVVSNRRNGRAHAVAASPPCVPPDLPFFRSP